MPRPIPFVTVLLLAACTAEEAPPPAPPAAPEAGETGNLRPPGEAAEARADLRPVGGSGVTGTARLVRYAEGVRVEVRAEGLAPGLHGLHVHDAADCAEAATSGHVNPSGAPHGDPEDPRSLHHAGDLGNLRATDEDARFDRIFSDLRLDGSTSIVGRILVVHADQDDLNTQPEGGAGAPVACGVIRPVE